MIAMIVITLLLRSAPDTARTCPGISSRSATDNC